MGKMASRPELFYGWFIVAVTFFIAFVTIGVRNGFGVFVVPMENEFGWDRSTTSVVLFTATLMGGLSQPVLGRLYDRLGGRAVILSGIALAGICTVLLSLTFHVLFLVLIYSIVMSVAMSGASVITTGALLSKWFRRRRATVLGLSTAGASMGGMVLVPFAAYFMDLAGWRTTWAVLGAIVLVLALPLSFLLLRDDPAGMGLLPDGDPKAPQGRHPATAQAARGPLEGPLWHASFRSLPMWQLFASYSVCGFTTVGMSMHFVPYAEGEGFSRSTAALAFGLMMGLNVAGVIGVSALSDKFGRKNLLAAVYATRGAAYAVLLLAPGAWALWGFAGIAGLTWITTVPLTISLTADIYGLRNLGTLTGIAYLGHQLGAPHPFFWRGSSTTSPGLMSSPSASVGCCL